MRFRPGSQATKESLWKWWCDMIDCAKLVKNKQDAWDTMVAFFCPHWWLRLYRRIKYGKRHP